MDLGRSSGKVLGMTSSLGRMGVRMARRRGEAEARMHRFERRSTRKGSGRAGGGGRDRRWDIVRTGRGEGWRESYCGGASAGRGLDMGVFPDMADGKGVCCTHKGEVKT
jgi:hypothetical protein